MGEERRGGAEKWDGNTKELYWNKADYRTAEKNHYKVTICQFTCCTMN